MSAIIGTHLIDLWLGDVPPQIKTTVATVFRPGQAGAAAKLLPNQSHAMTARLVQFRAAAGADAYVDGLRAVIGTILALTFRGVSYGNVLIGDITPVAIESLGYAAGLHPDASAYEHAPAARVTCQWTLIRLG